MMRRWRRRKRPVSDRAAPDAAGRLLARAPPPPRRYSAHLTGCRCRPLSMSVFDIKLVLLGCSSCGKWAWWVAADALGSQRLECHRCAAPHSRAPIRSVSICRQEHTAVPPGAWALPPGPAAHLWSRVWSQAGAWPADARLRFFPTGAGSRSADAAMACSLLGQVPLRWACFLAAVLAICPTSMPACPR